MEKKYIVEFPHSFKFITIDSKDEFNLKELEYCIKRKIDPIKWKIGYCDKGICYGRIIIPIYNNNNLIYWTARSFLNHERRYINISEIIEYSFIKLEETIFSGNIKEYNEIIVTEGILDVISLIDIGLNSCSVQGSFLSNYYIEYLKQFKNVIIGFDNDSCGRIGTFNAINNLNKNKIKCIKIEPPNNYKDWNQYYIENDKETVLNYILKLKNDSINLNN
jgi:DNA primase